VSPLLQQFLSEARDFLEGIGQKLMQLENAPTDVGLMTELFRFMHTLKGISGLFDFPEMTRVLHAGEDLLDAVRNDRIQYSQTLADRLLNAMDFVGMLCDEVEATGNIGATYASDSVRLTESLRDLMYSVVNENTASQHYLHLESKTTGMAAQLLPTPPIGLKHVPELVRMKAYQQTKAGQPVYWLRYTPIEECFFQGEDPFFQVRQTPELLWGNIIARESWPRLANMDAYRCQLNFRLLTGASKATLEDHFRFILEQIIIEPVAHLFFIIPTGDPCGGPVYEDFVGVALGFLATNNLTELTQAAKTMLELSCPDLWLSSALRWLLLVLENESDNHAALTAIVESLRSLNPPNWLDIQAQCLSSTSSSQPEPVHGLVENNLSNVQSAEHAEAIKSLLTTQRDILLLPITEPWQIGRMKAVSNVLSGCLRATGELEQLSNLALASEQSIAQGIATPLFDWLEQTFFLGTSIASNDLGQTSGDHDSSATSKAPSIPEGLVNTEPRPIPEVDNELKFGRRAEDSATDPKSLKVDQAKIDRLMSLIGEMVVSKNALPYLAVRAETVYGVRDLSREIKAQYDVINRIAEEMQDAIMQVRMMPVSFVFQRFPRLVRDISRKLDKDVNLVLEGEHTEADKNIIDSLGDPLIHIVRNSLDHGFELPDVRRASGKPTAGTLTIRAKQESDRVIIEIIDDGKGIDPEVVKRKAYEKGILDEASLEKISDEDAVNLIFVAGFSTVEVISDLSGRGVGMDVVRTAVEKVNGSIALESEKGKGTHIRLSLPLSMAVTNVIIIESNDQVLGVPMDSVVETVRIPRAQIRTIKHSFATVLRGCIVPLKSINALLSIDAQPQVNDDELAILVVRMGDESVGLIVDNFRETIEIILKPMTGVLANIPAYAGSALMGDGSVLLVLNVKELLQCP